MTARLPQTANWTWIDVHNEYSSLHYRAQIQQQIWQREGFEGLESQHRDMKKKYNSNGRLYRVRMTGFSISTTVCGLQLVSMFVKVCIYLCV